MIAYLLLMGLSGAFATEPFLIWEGSVASGDRVTGNFGFDARQEQVWLEARYERCWDRVGDPGGEDSTRECQVGILAQRSSERLRLAASGSDFEIWFDQIPCGRLERVQLWPLPALYQLEESGQCGFEVTRLRRGVQRKARVRLLGPEI